MSVTTKTRLKQLQDEMLARKQYKLNFEQNAVARAKYRQERRNLRYSSESPAEIERLFQLAAKTRPAPRELQSPVASTLNQRWV